MTTAGLALVILLACAAMVPVIKFAFTLLVIYWIVKWISS